MAPVARAVLKGRQTSRCSQLFFRVMDEEKGTPFLMNVAIANTPSRFNALLVEGDKTIGLEEKIREEGCSIRRASSRAAALEALPGTDLVVIAAGSLSDDEVIEVVNKANGAAQSVLVLANNQDLALRAAKAGASIVVGTAIELVSIQIKQLLTVVDLKRKVARQSSAPANGAGALSMSPTSGVVQRRSAPLPKEATPDALDALIEVDSVATRFTPQPLSELIVEPSNAGLALAQKHARQQRPQRPTPRRHRRDRDREADRLPAPSRL
jgi:hypothetical protein